MDIFDCEMNYTEPKMGNLLIEAGALTEQQVKKVLKKQKRSGDRFGHIAYEQFHVPARNIWEAYAKQVAPLCTPTSFEMEETEITAMLSVPIKDVWQYRILPLRHEDDMLVCAATRQSLAKALAYSEVKIKDYVKLVLVSSRDMDQFMVKLARLHKQAERMSHDTSAA